MNRILIALSCVLILFSCEPQSKEETARRYIDGRPVDLTLDELIKYELETGKTNDTIFLGFRLGMREYDARTHLNRLIKKGDIYEERGKYKSTLSAKYSSFKLSISFKYYKGELYKMDLNFKDDVSTGSSFLSTFDISELYREKFGLTDFFLEKEERDYRSFIWVSGNRMIDVHTSRVYDAQVSYIDTRRLMKKEREDDLKKKSKMEKSINKI